MTIGIPAAKSSGNQFALADYNNIRDDLTWLFSKSADIASAATITPTTQFFYLTGTTTVNTIAAGTVNGQIVKLIAKGQAAGVCVILAYVNGGNIVPRDLQSIGLYAGESITFVWDGTNWVEVERDLKLVLDYQQITAPVTLAGTTEGAATTVITASAITFDGATPILIQAFSPSIAHSNVTSAQQYLYDTGSSIGQLDNVAFASTTVSGVGQTFSRRLTPTAGSKTYSWRGASGAGTATVGAGAGGNGNTAPAYLRISRDI